MNPLTIICCGAAQRWIGQEQIHWPRPSAMTVAELLDALALRYPEFAPNRARTAAASGDSLLHGEQPIDDLAELALIPPVSGG